MPTKKQINAILATRFRYFGGTGVPKHNFDGNDGFGLALEMPVDKPIVSRKRSRKFNGIKIGRIKLDSATNDFKIIVNKKRDSQK